jgi:apolipoprotein N-acyltransferase
VSITANPIFSPFSAIAAKSFKTKLSSRLVMFAAGLLYPLAFAPFNAWPLAFVAITLLLIGLSQARPISAFKLGFYWGLGCFSLGASWVYVSIHEFGYVPWPGASLLTFAFVAYLSLFKGLFAYLVVKLIKQTSLTLLVLIAPLLWIISEFAQSTLLSGFPWLLTGYSQIDSPIANIATWFGVYGISWFVVALAAAFSLLLQRQSNQIATQLLLILMGLTIAFSCLDYSQSKPPNTKPETSIDIALVQPNVAQSTKWDAAHFRRIIQILRDETQPLWGADLVIWPEGAIPAYAHQVEAFTDELTQSAIKHDSHLIVGIPQYEPQTEQSFVALKAYGAEPQDYFKQVLVPFGEYVPLQQWLRGMIRFLDLPMSNFVPATNQQPMSFEKFSLIPAICYEVVYPHLLRNLSLQAEQQQKPQLIVTVSNDAWFGDSLGPYQHMQMARMRALELGLPLVRATNDGITAMVDANATVNYQLPRYYQGSLRQQLELKNLATAYKRWGFLGIGLISLISSLIILLFWLKNGQLKAS